MNTNFFFGLWNMLTRRPLALSVISQNLWRRAWHPYIKRKSQSENAPPEQITVVVTDVCNLRCKMCHYAFSESPEYQLSQVGKMESKLFYKLMDEIPGRPVVTFTGGETLLHPDIARFISYAKSLNRFCSLITNGWMLEKRAREICESGLDLLVVSVDGTQETNNRVRGENSFQRAHAGLKKVLEQPRSNRPFVLISMAISDLNYDQITAMYELASQWGVDAIRFNHLWMQTSKMTELYHARYSMFSADEVAWSIAPEKVDAEQVANALEEIRQRSGFSSPLIIQMPNLKKSEVPIWYYEPERFVKYDSTRCAWMRMKVWPDGKVKPCRGWAAGNVNERHALEIWNGEKYKKFRGVLAEDKVLPICARCCFLPQR